MNQEESPSSGTGGITIKAGSSRRRPIAVAALLAVVLALIGLSRGHQRTSLEVVRTISFGESRVGIITGDQATGRIFAAEEDIPDIAVFDGETYERLATVPTDGYHSGAAVDSITHRAYVAEGFSGTVVVIDGDTYSHSGLPVPDLVNAMGVLAVDAEGQRLYVGRNDNGDMALFDTDTNAFLGAICPGCCKPYCVDATFDSTSSRVYLTNPEQAIVSVIDSPSGQLVSRIALSDRPRSVATNPRTGRLYVSLTDTPGVAVIDIARGSPTENSVLTTIGVHDISDGLAVDPVRNRIYVASSIAGTVTVIDGATEQPAATIPVCDQPQWLVSLPSLGRIFVACTGARGVFVLEDSAQVTR